MTQTVENERVKLLANALDRASTAVFSVGVITPMASYFFNMQQIGDKFGPGGLIVFIALSCLAAAGLHVLARSVLGELQ